MVMYTDAHKRPPDERGVYQMVAGRHKVYLTDPQPDDFQPLRTALGLASEARYAGAYGDYRVAQHAVLVARTVFRMGVVQDGIPRPAALTRDVFAALHHEDAESVTGDLPQPVKSLCPGFKKLEARLDACVMERYDINIKLPAIKEADRVVLCAELRVLSGLTPEEQLAFYGEYGDPNYRRDVQPRYNELVLWSRDQALKEWMAMHEKLEARLGR